MSDSLTHLLSHVKNGQSRKLLTVLCPHSNLVVNVLHLLTRHGFIRGFRRHQRSDGLSSRNDIQVLLKYKNAKPAISSVHAFPRRQRGPRRNQGKDGTQRTGAHLSSAATPVYSCSNSIKEIPKGTISILSTPLGILERSEAEHHRVGGVVLCHVVAS